jgi:hypothetical protein
VGYHREVDDIQRLFGVVSFAGSRSRDGASLSWSPGGPASVYAAFDIAPGGSLHGWRERVLKHRGEAIFIATGGDLTMRLDDAVVLRATDATGLEIVSLTPPTRIDR